MRTRNTIINIFASVAMGIITILAGFIARRIFAHTLGLEYLGINGLITDIISMLGIVELGLSSAIVYHLYKPVSDVDVPKIKSIINFYKKSYRVIALIVMLIGVLVMPFLGTIVGKVNIPENIYVIYLIFLADIIFSYLLAYKQSILYADQKNYIINLAHVIYVLIMNGLQITVLLTTGNFYLYLGVKVIAHIIENLVIYFVVNIRYPYLVSGETQPLDIATKKDIIKKIKALFIHKVGGYVIYGTDSIIISVFLGIAAVGLYSNYFLVISAIIFIIGQVFTAITSNVGNLLVTSAPEKLYDVYNKLRFANFWLATVTTISFIVVMNSFVILWLGGKYVLTYGVLIALGVNLYLQLMRHVTNSFKDAAGIFHEDRIVPIVESIINIVCAITFLHIFGLAGVFMGTVCSTLLLHLYSYPKYVYTVLFKRSNLTYYFEFIKYLFFVIIICGSTFALSRVIDIDSEILSFAYSLLVALALPNIILYAIFRKSEEFIYFKNLLSKIYSGLRGRVSLTKAGA